MKNYVDEHQLVRIDLWAKAWVSVANANDCKSWDSATRWADEALKAFDERFKITREQSK